MEGIFNAVVETTFRVIGERRERTLRALAERISAARSEEEVSADAVDVFAAKSADVPFAYSIVSAMKAPRTPGRYAGLGESAAAPNSIDMKDSDPNWPLAETAELGRPKIVEDLTSRFNFPYQEVLGLSLRPMRLLSRSRLPPIRCCESFLGSFNKGQFGSDQR
ncbi:hypothetical protein [Neorhizobium sp. DT-125]|uniref:hypothetical protein n=1 Tax=Neorhizobium sp. DT-125 TaxID=3396163 RepID=UPI003F1DD0C4